MLGLGTRLFEVNCPSLIMFHYKKHMDLMLGGGSDLSVLVTMCGKSVDLLWLCSRGHSVTGVELSSIAVRQLFQESSIPHTVEGEYYHNYLVTKRCVLMVQDICDHMS